VFLTFLFDFAISKTDGMRYSKDEASYLNAGFFSSVALGQFLAIFLSKRFSAAGLSSLLFSNCGDSAS